MKSPVTDEMKKWTEFALEELGELRGHEYRAKGDSFCDGPHMFMPHGTYYAPPEVSFEIMHELIKGLDGGQRTDYLQALDEATGLGFIMSHSDEEIIKILTATVNQLLEAYYRTFHD